MYISVNIVTKQSSEDNIKYSNIMYHDKESKIPLSKRQKIKPSMSVSCCQKFYETFAQICKYR